jgi:hypothetical protein
MMNAPIVLFSVSRVLLLVVYVGMLAFALARAKRTPWASSLVVAAALLMLVAMATSFGAQILLTNLVEPESMVIGMGLISLAATMCSCLGLCLLTLAALGEPPASRQQQHELGAPERFDSAPPRRDP